MAAIVGAGVRTCKRGRELPPLGDWGQHFRAEESERGQFEQAAALADLKLSDWIRARLLACAQREIKRAAKP